MLLPCCKFIFVCALPRLFFHRRRSCYAGFVSPVCHCTMTRCGSCGIVHLFPNVAEWYWCPHLHTCWLYSVLHTWQAKLQRVKQLIAVRAFATKKKFKNRNAFLFLYFPFLRMRNMSKHWHEQARQQQRAKWPSCHISLQCKLSGENRARTKV